MRRVWITRPAPETFQVWHNCEDAKRASRAEPQAAFETTEVGAVPMQDIIGRLGQHWYVKRFF